METAQWIAFGIAVILMLVGTLGTILPALPGIPLIWLTILGFAFVEGFERVDTAFIVITLAVAVGSEVIDHLSRVWGARRFGAGKAGSWGAVIGAIGGLFFLPVGIVAGPFLGALVGELLAGRPFSESIRAGVGGLLGTLGSIVVKFVVAVGMTVAFVLQVL